MSSNIDLMLDYTAQRAGLLVSGVQIVQGMGTDLYNDPFRPGEKIAAATEWPALPFTHQSVEPRAPTVNPITQDGTYQLIWTIPMRLWVAKAPIWLIRKQLMPFYLGYLAAFAPDTTLGGLCLISKIARLDIGSATDWAWLQIDLSAEEQVKFT